MSLADMLLEKERERQDKVKLLLVKAYTTAKLDYEGATVWTIGDRRMLMVAGKVVDNQWWNRIVVSYLSKLAQKLIEKGDIGIINDNKASFEAKPKGGD